MTKAGIYIHIPFCKIKCMYCDFYSITKRENHIPHFAAMLIKEIKLSQKKYDHNWIFDTIFFGGGTPSLIEPKLMEKILVVLDNYYDISNVKEITIEANPGEAPLQRLKDFKKIGINRLSIGFQSLQSNLLTFLSRIHSPNDCISTFKNARNAGFDNINIDMIFNIPGQNNIIWETDLERVVALQPEHISAYSLTSELNTPLYRKIQNGEIIMPSEEIDLAMFEYSQNFLRSHDFQQYEISNYSKNNYKCHHNLHYWNLEPYLAFGPSAHGYDGYNRWCNISSLDTYLETLEKNQLPINNLEKLKQNDSFNELIFNGLRTENGINLKKIHPSYDLQNLYPIIEKWKKCMNFTKNSISLKSEYYKFADEISSDLMII